MFKNKSLNFKLRIAFGLISFILVVVGAVSLISLKKVVSTFDHVAKINLNNAIVLSAMDSSAINAQKNFLLMGISDDPDQIKYFEKRYYQNVLEFEKLQKDYEVIQFVEGESVLYSNVKKKWDRITKSFSDMEMLARDSSKEGIRKFTGKFIVDSKDDRESFDAAMKQIIVFHNKEAIKWTNEAEEVASYANILTTAIVVVGVIVSIILAFSISSNLSKGLKILSDSLNNGSQFLAQTSTEMAGASEGLSSKINELRAMILETAGPTEEISSMVKKAAVASKRLSDQANHLNELAVTLKQTINGVQG